MDNQMSNRRHGLRRLIILLVVLGLLFMVWQLLLRTPSVKISIPADADRVELRSVTTDQLVANVSKERSIRLASGRYSVLAFKGNLAVNAQMVDIKRGFRQSLNLRAAQAPSHQLNTVLHQRTDKLTPLGDGYLYINRQTRALEYAGGGAIQNVSSLFDISNTQSLDFSTLNTAINVESGKSGEVIVTTTLNVFVVKSLSDIVRLPAYDKEFLNFTNSAYDPQTNRVFVLSAYNPTIFYYDLGRPDDGPKVFYANKFETNRLAAGGGSLIAYFDDVPSLGSSELEAYARTRQLAPLVFNADEGKPLRALDQYVGATHVSISGSGKFMAVKKKFASTMTISNLSGGGGRQVIAPDTGGIAWQNDELYVGNAQALWLYKPAEGGGDPQLVAGTDAPIRYVSTTPTGVYVSTTADFTASVVEKSTASETIAEALRKLSLRTDDYFISFVSDGSKVAVVVETKGKFERGMEEADLQNAQAAQFQDAKTALGAYANDPNVLITQQDASIVSRYIYAGVPNDIGESEQE